jgi:hypothetical protein
MQLWPNYLIAVTAFGCAGWLHAHADPKKPYFESAKKWHSFNGLAALLGGIVHTQDIYWKQWISVCDSINAVFPRWLIQVYPDTAKDHMWVCAMVGIVLTEYYIVVIFLGPWMKRHAWLGVYLNVVVVFGIIVQLLSGAYSGIILCHLLSHAVGGAVAAYLRCWVVVAGFALNAGVGVLYLYMANCVVPSGPVSYDDWYHLYCSAIQIVVHWLIVSTTYVEELYRTEDQEDAAYAPVVIAEGRSLFPCPRRG